MEFLLTSLKTTTQMQGFVCFYLSNLQITKRNSLCEKYLTLQKDWYYENENISGIRNLYLVVISGISLLALMHMVARKNMDTIIPTWCSIK